MAIKEIKSRIVHKHDIEANWNKAINFTPQQGEIIVYDIDETHDVERFKIGDGKTLAKDLPFYSSAKPDWNQNDETADDYIKNRPFYEGEPKLVDVISETTVTVNLSNGMYYAPLTNFNDSFVNGQTYVVNFNGTSYECVARESENCVFVGNGTLPNGDGNIGNSEPFFLIYMREFGELFFNTTAAGTYTLSVATYAENIVQIDGRYIKDMYYDNGMVYIGSLNFIATSPNTMDYTYTNLDGNEVASYLSRLSGDGSVIQVNLDGKNGLMSTTFSRGWFSFTGILSGNMMNWNEGQIWSVTVNHPDIILSINNTYTVDFYDLSNSNIKYIDIKYLPSTVYTTYNAPIQHGSGEYSAVQGCDTIASGKESHAEGIYSTASGSTSHAEGFQTTASGPVSHSDGYHTTASGFCAHAEGYYTIAASRFQHVQGKCNIEDASDIYAHIVGNSEDDDSPSNAHTLDWNGNAWFAGDVYVGSTSGVNKDEGSVKLQKVITGTQGQVVGFDENGNAVAQDAPSGGSADLVVTFTMSSITTSANTGDMSISSFSHTYDEIVTAYNEGKQVLAICDDDTNHGVFYLTSIETDEVHFIGGGFYSHRDKPVLHLSIYKNAKNGYSGMLLCPANIVNEFEFNEGLSSKQDKITGTAGNLVVIGDDGNVTTAENDGLKVVEKESVMPNSANWYSMAYGDGKFVAITRGGDTVAYSTDGVSWIEATPLPSSHDWWNITYMNDKFIALAYKYGSIAYSKDLITWTEIQVTTSGGFKCGAYGNGKYVLVYYGSNTVFYSEDLITWKSKAPPLNMDYLIFANGKFIGYAKSKLTNNDAVYSEDGVNWTSITLPRTKESLTNIAYGNGRFIILVSSYKQILYYSEDGITWNETAISLSISSGGIAYGNGRFVLGTGFSFYFSEDGTVWTKASSTFTDKSFNAEIVFGGGKFVTYKSNSDTIAYSTDGMTWRDTFPTITQSNEDITDKVVDAILSKIPTAEGATF